MKIINDYDQGDMAWLQDRAGCVSGTKLSIVMGGPVAQNTLMFDLIAEEIAPLEENYVTPAMQRGTDLEPVAIELFEDISGLKVDQVGLIKKDDFHICSPDGIIYNRDGIITNALEVKCLAAKKMLKYMMTTTFKDVYKIEKTYYWQVVNYFAVIDTLDELTFFLYNPDMYDIEQQTHSIKVTREELKEDIEKALERVSIFKEQVDKLKNRLKNIK